MTSPATIGYKADDALSQAIAKYVEGEINIPEHEEVSHGLVDIGVILTTINRQLQRLPKIHRFPQSSFEAVGTFHRQPEVSRSLAEPTSSSNLHQQTGLVASIVHHMVSMEQSSTATVSYFKLRDLPGDFLQRTLTGSCNETPKALEIGVTCRAVRWNSSREKYVFNGRVGAPINGQAIPSEKSFGSTTYVPLDDGRHHAIDAVQGNQQQQQPRTWKFKGDAPESLQRFVQGMGEIIPDDPGNMPEVPPDAKKFQARPENQIAGPGRTRVPKGATALDSSEDEEDVSKTPLAGAVTTFNQLLTRQANAGDAHSESEEDSLSDNSVDDKTPTFKDLFHKTSAGLVPSPPPSQVPDAVIEVKAAYLSLRTSHEGEKGAISVSRSISETERDESRPGQPNSFHTSDRKYARLDKAGLTSIASNQAQWEHENPTSPKPNTNRYGISRRQPPESAQTLVPVPTNGSSAAMSLSIGPELQKSRYQSTPATLYSAEGGSIAVGGSAYNHSTSSPWANKVVRPKPSPTKLIDDTAPQSPSPPNLPPGLVPPPTPGFRKVTGPKLTGSQTGDDEMLIDLSHDESKYLTPNAAPSDEMVMCNLLRPSDTPAIASASASSCVLEDDDKIIERLQQFTEEPGRKRDTMRQKKGKGQNGSSKKAKSKNNATNSKAELPKPDPLPPPKKPAAIKKEKPASGLQTNASTSTLTGYEGSAHARQKSLKSLPGDEKDQPEGTEPVNGIAQLVQQVMLRQNVAGSETFVQLGLILTQHNNKDICKGSLTPATLQRELQDAGVALQTDFLPRMTTFAVDASYMLGLVVGNKATAKVQYEILIKNSEGSLRVVKFDQMAKHDFLVLRSDSELGTLYMHFPVRVWDAKVLINKPEVDELIMDSAGTFVSSMQTVGEAPIFQAMVPSDSFTVEKVYVKKVFTKQSADEIELHVTEVQELVMVSLTDPRYNFKAIALQVEEMIEEHRLWWECSLHVSSVDAVPAPKLQSVVDDMVSKMDDVGFKNKGPWVRGEIEEEGSIATEIRFW